MLGSVECVCTHKNAAHQNSGTDRFCWAEGCPCRNFQARQWTEEQIRQVMDDHRPGNEGYCLCAWAFSGNPDQEFTVDHFIEKLKEVLR